MTKMPIIDSDVHCAVNREQLLGYLPEPWRTRYASGNSGPGTLGYWNPNGVVRPDTRLDDGTRIHSRPELLVEHHFDKYDIAYGILNPEGLGVGVSPEPDWAAAKMSAMNDVFVNEWLPMDERFRYSLMISPADPALAAREIHRLGDHPRVVQVLMCSGARMPYGQRFFHPIYEAAAQYDLPVAIHPGTEGAGVSGPPTAVGYPSSYLEWHTGLAYTYMAHLVSLVTEGVFQKFPTLKFVLIEGGVSWLPTLLWRLDKNWKGLRMTTPWLDRPPSEIAHEHIRLTTQPIEEPDDLKQLHQILAMFPAEQMLMFSSDFPHWDGDTPDFAARLLPKHLRPSVMHKTARKLYKLPEGQQVTQLNGRKNGGGRMRGNANLVAEQVA